MTINAYLPTSGASFSPKSAANMGKALDGAVDILGIGPDDATETRSCRSVDSETCRNIDGGAVIRRMLCERGSSTQRDLPPHTAKVRWAPGRTVRNRLRTRQFVAKRTTSFNLDPSVLPSVPRIAQISLGLCASLQGGRAVA